MYHFCTYFDRNYLVRGLALYHSLVRHSPPFRLYMLCMDDVSYEYLRTHPLPHAKPIPLAALEASDAALRKVKSSRSLVEYYFTATPCFPLYILDRFPDIDTIVYLDADLYFFADPSPIFAELGDQSILIVEHRFPELLRHLETRGIYNVGLVGFRNDAAGRRCLEWWRARCLEWCYTRVEDGKFADQKYLDDWPSRFADVVVLQHKGAGLSPWNVSRYDIRRVNGQLYVDQDALVFYHFHNVQRFSPWLFNSGLREYGTRLNAVLRKRVYLPYIREWNRLICRTSIASENSPRYTRYRNIIELLTREECIFVTKFLSARIALFQARRGLSRVKHLLLKYGNHLYPSSRS